MEREEREQLTYLVNLYSLNMRIEMTGNGQSCPVISKTSNTPQAVKIEQVTMNINDYKKRRKTPQLNAGNLKCFSHIHKVTLRNIMSMANSYFRDRVEFHQLGE